LKFFARLFSSLLVFAYHCFDRMRKMKAHSPIERDGERYAAPETVEQRAEGVLS
jgi:hypothetical protein